MPLSSQLLSSSHLLEIEASIEELLELSTGLGDPAPVPHQYVGTVVDNVICLLTAPANSLDAGSRLVIPSEDRTWLSTMVAVHRAFLASLQAGIEAGLVHMCQKLGVAVQSRSRARATRLAASIREKVDATPIRKELRDLERMGDAHPSFDDYLAAVLRTCLTADDRRSSWRHFFRALSIARNKAAHFDPRLTPLEREELVAGGLGSMVDERGELQINPRMYTQLARLSVNFFSEALQGMPRAGS